MTPRELFEAGKLKDAISTLVDEIKKNPLDKGRRGFLCELLCFNGDMERTDVHLDAVAKQDASIITSVALFRQLVRAEQARQQLYTEGRVPEFLDKPNDRLQAHLQTVLAVRDGDMDEAKKNLDIALSLIPSIKGKHGDQSFEGFRDLDDLIFSVFEVYTSTGKYYWIPIEQVRSVEFRPIESPRDLLWRRVHMVVTDGPDGEVYLPAIYPGAKEQDEALQLGRSTEWIGDDDAVVRGAGQRTYLVGDEDVPIHLMKDLEFE